MTATDGTPARLVLAAAAPGRIALRAPALWLTGLVLISTGLRFLAAHATPAPSIFPDELIYFDLARSLALDGGFTVFGVAFSPWTYGVLYPMLIAPIFLVVGDGEAAYEAIKLVNCLVASLAAVPAYFLARRFLTERRALLFAALCLALPSLVYTTKIMTESLAYPVFLLTFIGLQRALERPTTGRQLAALALLSLAVLARVQMVALVPAYGAAILASAFVAADSGPAATLRRFRPTWAALGAGIAALGLAAAGSGFDRVLGLHATVARRIDWGAAAVWAFSHLAELTLAAGVVPVGAFVLLAISSSRRAGTTRETRVFVVLTASIATFLLTLVALYATQEKMHARIYERYLIYLVPLFLLALLVWLEHDRKPRRWSAVVFAAVALLPLGIPFGEVLYDGEWGVSSSTASLVPWALLRLFTGSLATVYVATLALSLLLVSLTLLRRRAHVIPRALLLTFLGCSLLVQVASLARSAGAAELGLTPGRTSWIDAAVGDDARVGAIWSGSDQDGWRGAFPIWHGAFFNRSISGLYSPTGTSLRHLPAHRIPPARGQAVVAYVLVDPTVHVDGEVVARDARTGMTLVRVVGPLRVHASRYGRAAPMPR